MADLRRFIARRFLTFVPTIIGVTLLVYIIAAVIPANPARLWAGGQKASPEVVERLIREYHLNDPWYIQYYYFMKNLFFGNPVSPVTHNNVWSEITDRFLTVTLPLTLLAFVLIVVIGVPLGVLAAIKRDTAVDMVIRGLALVGLSTPIFWLAYLMIFVLYPHGLVTLAGMPTPSYRITGVPLVDALLKLDPHYLGLMLKRLWLPAFMLAYPGIGVITRLVRNSFLDAYSRDYVDFMEARGFPRRRVYLHVLRNSLSPIVTVLGLQFGGLLAGAPITETIFGLPGLGLYMLQAIENFDYMSLTASVLLVAFIYTSVNLVVDVLYAVIDPRVRY
ncbi:peptide ABC transporter permease [Pyrodictium occultum]|uniref:Peptide ABC transporter permease n=1 Tax=Pyrodictium occultum TaxID=2309 RepID=A0A0V8RVL1_PYROC|nr:ABC transporter permease [Pyrodictium occultum]KSW12084.1 peptide ABC transporter permease [Pyrodictium occultum]